MKNQIILFLLKFRPWKVELKNDDYWGRRRFGYKTLFGKKYWSPRVEHADLIMGPKSQFVGYSNAPFTPNKAAK